MGIHLFCGDAKDREHEWEQLVEICEIIHYKGYAESKPIYLLYNFELIKQCQIDLLIILEKGICILELKSYKGKIIGNDVDSKNWKVKADNKTISIRSNPFIQLKRQRSEIIKHLGTIRKNFSTNIKPINIRKVKAWGYFKKGSEFDDVQISDENKVWFDVITDDDLLRKLRYVDSDYRLAEQDMVKIVESLNLKRYIIDDIRLEFLSDDESDSDWSTVLRNIADTYLQNKKVVKSALIPSIGLGEGVSYTPMRITYKAISQKKEEKPALLDIDFIIESLTKKIDDESLIKPIFVTAEGGYGKTSLSKQIFLESSQQFIDGKIDFLPFLIQLSDYGHSSLRFSEWIEDQVNGFNLFGMNSKLTYRRLLNAGLFLLLIDGLDNLPPDHRREMDQWLAESYEFGNRLLITSRPYVQPNIKVECERLTILPLTLDLIEDFISNRQKDKRLLKNIINKIRTIYNPLLFIPFYLDLIASLRTEDFPDDEISLFAIWLLVLEKKHSYLCENLNLAEKLAFEFCFPKNKVFSKDQIKDITKDNKFFKRLERAGWIKPTDSFYHQYYTFTHDRLREYLAGRYIWNNWDEQVLRIYDDEDCLLRFNHSDKIFEFSFLYGDTLRRQDNKIQDRLEVLCGKLNLTKKNQSYDNLKAPFLACYIASYLDMDETSYDWISKIRNIAHQLWIKYFAGNKYYKIRYNIILERLYRIISKVMLFVDIDLSKIELEEDIIESKDKIEPSKYSELEKILGNSRDIPASLFENNLMKLVRFAQFDGKEQDFMLFTNKMPYNPKLKGFYSDIVNDMNQEDYFQFEWAAAAYVFMEQYPNELQQLFSNWSSSNDMDFEFLALERWFVLAKYNFEALTAKGKKTVILICQNEKEKWLNSKFPEVRNKAIEVLYKCNRIFDFDVEVLFDQHLTETDFTTWIDCIRDYYLQKLHPSSWLKRSRKKLRKWVYKNLTIKEMDRMDFFFGYDYFELLKEIKEYYDKSLSADEAIILARRLSNREENVHSDDFFGYLLDKFSNNKEIKESYDIYKITNLNLEYIKESYDKADSYINSEEFIIHYFDEFYKKDNSLAIQVLEKQIENEYPESLNPILKLLRLDKYDKKQKLLEFVFNNNDWRYAVIILIDIFLQTPTKVDLKPYIEKLLEHENETVRFYSTCSLIYLHDQMCINKLLKKRFDDKSNLVRAAAFRVAAMLDGVDFSKVTFYFEWGFYSRQPIEFTRDYCHVGQFDVKNLKLNDSQQISYGISYKQIKPLLKNLYDYNNKELPSIHPLDLSLEMKCKDSKNCSLPLWLKKGLEDSNQKIILAVLQYLLYYLTNLEVEINFGEITKLLKEHIEHENESIVDFAKSILFLIDFSMEETKAIVEFTTNIEKKSNFEQRFIVWILGRKRGNFIDNTLFDILLEVYQKAKDLIGLFSVLTLERFQKYLLFIAEHPESTHESEIFVKRFFGDKKEIWKLSGISGDKVQLIDWSDIPNINLIWEYLSKITNMQNIPKYTIQTAHVLKRGLFVKETSVDVARLWLRKINPEFNEIDEMEFKAIIDKLASSNNVISSSLGIILSYHSGYQARNLSILIDDQIWLKNNLPYLLECLDNLPLNKTDFIEMGIESKDILLMPLALNQITNEFTCDEILSFFKKILVILNEVSKAEKKSFSQAVVFGAKSQALNQISTQFKKKWVKLSGLFVTKRNNCMDYFLNWIDEIIELRIDIFHIQWWAHFDIGIIFDLFKWSSLAISREKFFRLLQYDIYTYYYTRNWYRNPGLWKAFLEENSKDNK